MSMLGLPAPNACARAATRARPRRIEKHLDPRRQWMIDRRFLATATARPRHAVQFWCLWITVRMWTRCGWALRGRVLAKRSPRPMAPLESSLLARDQVQE